MQEAKGTVINVNLQTSRCVYFYFKDYSDKLLSFSTKSCQHFEQAGIHEVHFE